MIHITQQHLSEPQTSSEVLCAQHISQWSGKDVSKGIHTKGELVDGLHAVSEKAITELQTSIEKNRTRQDEMPTYPYKELLKFIGYCGLAALVAALVLGILGTAVVVMEVELGLSIGAKMGIFVPCMLATPFAFMGYCWLMPSEMADKHLDFRCEVYTYEKELGAYFHNRRSELTNLGAVVYQKEDREWKIIAGELAEATSQRSLRRVGEKITRKCQQIIETIRHFQKDRLVFANRIANHFTTAPDKAVPFMHTFVDMIRKAELAENITESIGMSWNFEPRLIDLIIAYLGTKLSTQG